MSRPAAFLGDYVDCRFLPGLKLARISIEIPIEQANAFLSAFGAPDKASPVKVGIARLNEGALTRLEYPPEAEPEKRTYTRSQIAALRLKDFAFGTWLSEAYREIWARAITRCETGEQAAEYVFKEALGIKSKTELDTEGPRALAFDRLLTDFSVRGIVR